MSATGFQKKLAELRDEYARRLPERIAQALALVDDSARDPSATASLVELRRVLHTLAGNAATFGRAALGARAKELEHAVEALEQSSVRTAADFEALRPAIASLVDA